MYYLSLIILPNIALTLPNTIFLSPFSIPIIEITMRVTTMHKSVETIKSDNVGSKGIDAKYDNPQEKMNIIKHRKTTCMK